MSSRNSQQLNLGGGCMCLCGLKFKKEKEEKCPNHLENWDVWMQRRKRMHEILSKKLERSPGDLLMNSGDTYRSIREEKLILGYTRIETYFDKYRGNPDFWKLPWSFKSRQPPFKRTEYFMVKSKEEQNQIPDITYVGVPDLLLKEKDIVPRTRHLKELWRQSSYREEVRERLSEKLLEIEPHKPDISNLIILGSNFASKKSAAESRNSVSRRSTRASKKSVEQLYSKYDTRSSINTEKVSMASVSTLIFKRLSLKINNKEFSDSSATPYRENKITVMFEYCTDSITPCQQYVLFENSGQVALRLHWEQYKKLKIFREYTDTTDVFHPFKFNKNELLLLPGKKQKLPIWFKVNRPGNYFEHWELTTSPRIWRSEFRLILVLKGFALIRDYELRLQQLSVKLCQRIRDTTIKDTMSDLVSRGSYCTPTTTQTFNFSEEGLFESVNLIGNIGVYTPKYIYNQKIISELKDFYTEARFADDPEQWDFSIKKLGEIARKRDLFSYFDSKLALYNTAKLKRKELQESTVESQSKSKPGSKKEKEGRKTIIDKAQEEPEQQSAEKTSNYYYDKLNDILRKLEKPSIYINKERKKYLFCYIIFKTLFWKMFDQLDKPENSRISIIEEEKGSEENIEQVEIKEHLRPQPIPDRLIYETFDERYILRTKIITGTSGTSIAKPKSKLLKEIPSTDIKKLFKTYFNKDDPNQKATKGKAQEKESKKPASVKGQKNKEQAKQDEEMYLSVNEDFDPFSGYVHCTNETPERTDSPDINFTVAENTNEEKYLMVYVTLSNAIDALVDIVEAFDERNIPSDTLGELQKCNVSFGKVKFSREKASEKSSLSTVGSNFSVETLQKEPSVQSYSDYFEFLQETHWQNNVNTKKYYVAEEKQASVSTSIPGDAELDMEHKIKKALSNMFSLEDFKRKVEPYCLKERAAQTEIWEDDSETPLEEEATLQSESITGPTDSSNIFYFLDNITNE